MNLLAIDTATSVFSVALGTEGGIWHFETNSGMRHSELLIDTIDMLIKKSGLEPSDLEGVLCMRGPGSFTGLRIGFAAAKGLALALNIPFLSFSTLDCMACAFSGWPGLVVPIIDAKKHAFFYALYSGGRRLCPDTDAAAPEIARSISAALLNPGVDEKRVFLTGPGAEMLYRELSGLSFFIGVNPRPARGNALSLLDLAKNADIINNSDINAGPEYIRKSDAELFFKSW
ncbi:MAG: tRNA (adenosine(37)-N6)-threonylcarbamoyltransferase complex dimerization subunit type 1 TsaB [Treponema sp.]|jgi:tRNA threonylcarbamoyladenosine biosynthesis protein TsaB|nr:tRNA (adenosine(37)-N6)-threonylcarbamoyltransferase complex dimerization subunit type 1 TsaB [Treponema sp.]